MKSIFGIKPTSTDNLSVDNEAIEYDKHVDFYYSNLINSIILFSLTSKDLEELAGPVFNPMTELESEIDYAFTPVCFDTIFRNGLIDKSFKDELLQFKKWTDDISSEIWDWEFIDNHEAWVATRLKANALLDKLGVTSRTYNDDYTTIYDNEGNIIKKGKNSP
ncbi:hypothetical protein P3875_06725 [Myroides sp. JBRI-B21084]|uniref:hypothetical protein n=1 Tax=Myroides sp. JBRI-B21084 TaxID=3119977 RepID=UPI0026E27D15|nr:hypothetical protein [Paenimyroides cloacae]WKW45480.1 hypothetical protein P3875_06725 [Paenimyroides cloacae]